MDVFPASSLGKETDIGQGLTLGTVDIIYTGQLFAQRAFGPIAIGGAPFVFRDFDHWKKYIGSPLFRELADGYQKGSGGNKIVTVTYYGNRQTTANKALNKPEDMKGLKIRVPDAPLYTLFPRAVGANPTPIAFAEVYLALQNKTVDAQENPLPTIDAKKFYEVQSHINITAHITDALLTIIGAPLWSKLRRRQEDLRGSVPGSCRQGDRRNHRYREEIDDRLHEAWQDGRDGGPQAVHGGSTEVLRRG